jgi:hypothetical protein
MAVTTPSDTALAAAEIVLLVDESLPQWKLPFYLGKNGHEKLLTRIVVKVDARKPGELRAWRERLKRLRGEQFAA